tara:strand:- start:21 stop:272 length:252 start_codon:yes stop_codon:yes gene_type:complete
MKKKKIPNRRPCYTTEVGEGLAVTVSFHPDSGEPIEVFITGRGKASNSPMQDALYNMGVQASELMQMENPLDLEASLVEQSAE